MKLLTRKRMSLQTHKTMLLSALHDYFYENQDTKPHYRTCFKLFPVEDSTTLMLGYGFLDPDEERRIMNETSPEYYFMEES